MTEKQLQDSIIEYLRLNKLFVLRVNSGKVQNMLTGSWIQLAEKGTSDIICENKYHRLSFIEIKTSVGRLSDEQTSFLREQHMAKRPWCVAMSIADVTRWLADGDYHGAEKHTQHILDDSKKFIRSNVRNRRKTDAVDFWEYEAFCRKKESTGG